MAEAQLGGGQNRIDKQHEERETDRSGNASTFSLDPGSFRRNRNAGHPSFAIPLVWKNNRIPGDGVVTGYGTVNGRPGVRLCPGLHRIRRLSCPRPMPRKICKIMDLAMQNGAPVIGLNDSGGARIQEGVKSLGGYADIFYRNVTSSGVVPQISAIMGPCAGGAVYSPAMTDFTVMVEGTSYMFVTGPNVVKTVTNEEVTAEELGGASAHATKSGVTHLTAANDIDCIEKIKLLMSYIPQNCEEKTPRMPFELGEEIREELNGIIPDSSNQPYDMRDVVSGIVDADSFLEIHKDYADNIIVGFARIAGRSIGIVGNQPMSLAGVLDVNSSKKGARFVRFCDCFNIPLLVLVDVPGFLPGTDQEWNGIIVNGSKLLYAFSEATVPRVTLITRKAYGGAYDVMNSKHIGADMNYAWPSAEIAVMGAKGASEIIFRKEIAAADDPEAVLSEKEAKYQEMFANPYRAARRGFIDEVIEPKFTRRKLIRAYEMLENKVAHLPKKKHGNIPL
jgi:propionyl-CoA carboxylase beta chain